MTHGRTGRSPWHAAVIGPALAGALLIAMAFGSASGHHALAAGLFAISGAVCLVPVAYRLTVADDGPRIEPGPRGTTFRPSRASEGLYALMLPAAAIVFAAWSAAAWAPDALPVLGDLGPALAVCAAALATCCVVSLLLAVRRGGSTWLRLGPEGVELPAGLGRARGGWDELTGIDDRMPVRLGDGVQGTLGRGDAPNDPLVFVMARGRRLAVDEPARLTTDPPALRGLALFYWQHPERRAELLDGRAAARLNG